MSKGFKSDIDLGVESDNIKNSLKEIVNQIDTDIRRVHHDIRGEEGKHYNPSQEINRAFLETVREEKRLHDMRNSNDNEQKHELNKTSEKSKSKETIKSYSYER